MYHVSFAALLEPCCVTCRMLGTAPDLPFAEEAAIQRGATVAGAGR